MSKEIACPHCGIFVPIDETHPCADESRTIETLIPATMSLSGDPLGEILPSLATRLTPESEDGAVGPPSPSSLPTPEVWAQPETGALSLHGSSVVDIPAAITEGDGVKGPVGSPVASLFPVLETGSPVVKDLASTAKSPPPSVEFEEAEEPRGPSMLVVLLASYASAMTLACGWLLWQAKHRDMSAGPDTLPTDSRPDDRSAKLTPIATDHTTTLGKPLRIGDLELTPIRARFGRVMLETQTAEGRSQSKPGAGESVLLTLRLKNLSKNTTFEPIEDAFVRTPDRGAPDSFIETPDGTLDLYPLAISSEWRIVGQENRPLKPGESMETLLASAPESAGPPSGSMRLRLKLHPDATTSTVIHIQFDGDAIQ